VLICVCDIKVLLTEHVAYEATKLNARLAQVVCESDVMFALTTSTSASSNSYAGWRRTALGKRLPITLSCQQTCQEMATFPQARPVRS
jgi:hypothetical protein